MAYVNRHVLKYIPYEMPLLACLYFYLDKSDFNIKSNN
jgi:hypothetical protein